MPNLGRVCTFDGEGISAARSLLILTGAGISAESGLPTYRGQNGAFAANPNLPQVLSAQGLAENPHAVWEYINQFRIRVAAVQPNPAHRILAEWEQAGRFKDFLIATQNIDGLHQAAGSQRISQLHGNVWQFAAPRQVEYAEDETFSDDAQAFLAGEDTDDLLRKWSEENDSRIWYNPEVPFQCIPPDPTPDVRPNVLLYDEPYGLRTLWVNTFIREKKPDAVLVIGCSGNVAILQRLLDACRRANPACQVININPHESCIPFDHLHIRLPATEALTQIQTLLRD